MLLIELANIVHGSHPRRELRALTEAVRASVGTHVVTVRGHMNPQKSRKTILLTFLNIGGQWPAIIISTKTKRL